MIYAREDGCASRRAAKTEVLADTLSNRPMKLARPGLPPKAVVAFGIDPELRKEAGGRQARQLIAGVGRTSSHKLKGGSVDSNS